MAKFGSSNPQSTATPAAISSSLFALINLRPWEEFDDDNTADGDGCSAQCKAELIQIAAGLYHVCALRGDGRVFCWGAK
jgi:cysteine-rich repeat protein